MEKFEYEVVVVGAGPNGLTASALLSQLGLSTLVVEAADEVGGGMRSLACTLPGYIHDVCSAVHTTGCVSPVFKRLQLEQHGLTWIHPEASVAHPLEGRPAVMLEATIEGTVAQFGRDAEGYRRLVRPIVEHDGALVPDLLGPLSVPRRPIAIARFGLNAMRSARGLALSAFEQEPARALFAGCAAHSVQPLENWLTSAIGLVLMSIGHLKTWPVARGGSSAIATALRHVNEQHGVQFRVGHRVSSLRELPAARAYLFDLTPGQLVSIAGDALPARYVRQLRRYRMGPGVFKVDYALSGSIPWSDPNCRRASTVHVGGTLDEMCRSERAMWNGDVPDEPFVLMTQQSEFDASRAPSGHHTGYAYCHVPAGCEVDMTEAIERQISRFAPGFRDLILERRKWFPADLERHNANYPGGVITGGVADLTQLFTRPSLSLRPYATPNPRLFLCSQSTPPGGGVHGMCGFHAARLVAHRVFGRDIPRFA